MRINKIRKRISFIVLVVTLSGLMISFVKIQGATSFQGTVEDRLDVSINGAGVVLADCYYNILGFDTTDSSGDYSFSVTLNGNSPYYLSVAKTGFESDTKTVYSGGTYDFTLLDPIRIGVFFWATDAGLETYIDDYIEILDDEGYEKFFKFEDSSNVASDCQTVENFEYEDDTIFTYIIGHGGNNGSHSYTYFKEDENSQVYSNTFRGYMDDWEADRKCLLVDSCYSGDWADDFAANPYLAMSSADEDHLAWTYQLHNTPWEGDFSHHFFYAVNSLEYNAVDAFDYADSHTYYDQYPKKQDNSSYEWFDD